MNIIEYVKSKFYSKESTIYDERIKCFEKLIELQRWLKSSDEEYVQVSTIEGKPHTNAYNRIECYTKDYKREYELCEKIIKY